MAYSLDFSGQTALVVGGSSGIGNGIAHAFKDCGADVHVWGTRESASAYSPEDGSLMDGLSYQQVDVKDATAISDAMARLSRLDVLVCSQGTVLYKRGEFDMAGFAHVLAVNLSSVMACALAAKEKLTAARGSLIAISSTAAYHATRGNPAYSASKTGVVGLVRTLGQAWAGDGVRVNGVAPGLVDTKLTKVTTQNPARLEASLATIPLGRLGQPADMAGACLFLASPLAAYIIGQTIPVDGGLIL